MLPFFSLAVCSAAFCLLCLLDGFEQFLGLDPMESNTNGLFVCLCFSLSLLIVAFFPLVVPSNVRFFPVHWKYSNWLAFKANTHLTRSVTMYPHQSTAHRSSFFAHSKFFNWIDVSFNTFAAIKSHITLKRYTKVTTTITTCTHTFRLCMLFNRTLIGETIGFRSFVCSLVHSSVVVNNVQHACTHRQKHEHRRHILLNIYFVNLSISLLWLPAAVLHARMYSCLWACAFLFYYFFLFVVFAVTLNKKCAN